MSKTTISKILTRYKIKTGNFIATFDINEDGKMTFYSSPQATKVKDYHFELSNPSVVKAVAKLLGQSAKVAEEHLKGKK